MSFTWAEVRDASKAYAQATEDSARNRWLRAIYESSRSLCEVDGEGELPQLRDVHAELDVLHKAVAADAAVPIGPGRAAFDAMAELLADANRQVEELNAQSIALAKQVSALTEWHVGGFWRAVWRLITRTT